MPETHKGLGNVPPRNPNNNNTDNESKPTNDSRVPGMSTIENPNSMDTLRG